MADYTKDDRFRGARIRQCDLGGLEIRDCDLSGMKITDSWASVLQVDGYFDRLVVNDVEVGAYVEAELDRRHPLRALARHAASPEDLRAAWDAIEAAWAATIDRARRLPPDRLQQRVGGEWSVVDTQRHLLFATDAWLGNAVLEEPAPYHPLGLPAEPGFSAEETATLGLTPEATPTFDEVLAARQQRMATVRRVLAGVTEPELERICGRKPADPYPDQEYVVGRCVKVVLKEEAEHHRYTTRDLGVLEDQAQEVTAAGG